MCHSARLSSSALTILLQTSLPLPSATILRRYFSTAQDDHHKDCRERRGIHGQDGRLADRPRVLGNSQASVPGEGQEDRREGRRAQEPPGVPSEARRARTRGARRDHRSPLVERRGMRGGRQVLSPDEDHSRQQDPGLGRGLRLGSRSRIPEAPDSHRDRVPRGVDEERQGSRGCPEQISRVRQYIKVDRGLQNNNMNNKTKFSKLFNIIKLN